MVTSAWPRSWTLPLQEVMSGRNHFASNTAEHLETNAQELLLPSPVLSPILSTRDSSSSSRLPTATPQQCRSSADSSRCFSYAVFDLISFPVQPPEAGSLALKWTHSTQKDTEAWVKVMELCEDTRLGGVELKLGGVILNTVFHHATQICLFVS